jgi:hypothetical protein
LNSYQRNLDFAQLGPWPGKLIDCCAAKHRVHLAYRTTKCASSIRTTRIYDTRMADPPMSSRPAATPEIYQCWCVAQWTACGIRTPSHCEIPRNPLADAHVMERDRWFAGKSVLNSGIMACGCKVQRRWIGRKPCSEQPRPIVFCLLVGAAPR